MQFTDMLKDSFTRCNAFKHVLKAPWAVGAAACNENVLQVLREHSGLGQLTHMLIQCEHQLLATQSCGPSCDIALLIMISWCLHQYYILLYVCLQADYVTMHAM